jgi:uncharacterized protein YyaL (SSP411 family)
MERESFEDSEIAQILNQSFVAVKVDREERGDIDTVYMAVCQAITGQGGWPMTIVMTPEKKPFFAATYLPKRTGYGTIGLSELLGEITRQWQSNPQDMLNAAEQISSFLKEQVPKNSGRTTPSQELVDDAVLWFSKHFDRQNGGFSQAPKFPSPHNLLFLLHCYEFHQDETALSLTEKTLQQMYRGGIFDHVGGGFSRYSTDDKWLIPHFEKMLYDNALLALTYAEAFRLTRKELYGKVAEATLSYVLRELTHEDGGFYCGQDADSDGVEGKYYVFSKEEIENILKEDAEAFNRWFGITSSGNFEGKNLPNLLGNDDFCKSNEKMDKLCQTLYEYRLHRTQLHKDDKILTGWNSLMIAAMARTSQILNEPRYLDAAKKAQAFVSCRLLDIGGRLHVRWRDGEAKGEGLLDDYAFYCWSLLELYAATLDVYYLAEGVRIAELMLRYFFDEKNGGFYLNASDAETLIIRPKELYDGAMPSGNSVAALVLEKLFKLTGDVKWQKYSKRQLGFLLENMDVYPAGYSFSLLAVMDNLYPSRELICVSNEAESLKSVLTLLGKSTPANINVLFKTSDNEELLKAIAPFTANYPIPKSGTAYYLCQDGTCSPPVYNSEDLNVILHS